MLHLLVYPHLLRLLRVGLILTHVLLDLLVFVLVLFLLEAKCINTLCLSRHLLSHANHVGNTWPVTVEGATEPSILR